eukprot:gene25429-11089_t
MHLHKHICASVLSRKVFVQPFNHDVQLTVSDVESMTSSLLHCQRTGGILIVAREHRLSLQLKAIELRAKGDTQVCSSLNDLANLPYIDILDESDELLHHRYQLIYAVGARSALPARQQRAEAIQCLLHAVSHQMDSSISTDAILDCILCDDRDASEFLGTLKLQDSQKDQLLALRGLLARNVLTHCLEKRHLVEFGVNRSPSARKQLGVPITRKRLGVPFTAANTPSERSEYAHPDADDHQKMAWQLLLDTAVKEGHDALIDCGAILADTSNRNAADYLLPKLDPTPFKGVVYFHTSFQLWMALERRGRCQPLQSSPLAERDAFVIFDDARCRGADMILRSDAVGLLTIGPGMVKDKMIQAAGRLRQLDKGQRLCLVGTADVSMKIGEYNNKDPSSITSLQVIMYESVRCSLEVDQQFFTAECEEPDSVLQSAGNQILYNSLCREPDSMKCSIANSQVLSWVMHNTVQATILGVPEWAYQGLHFIRTKGRPDHLIQDEVLELDRLYAGRRDMARPVLDDKGIDQGAAKMVPALLDRASKYGQGQEVLSGHSISEECERVVESEMEKEEEEEVEREAARVDPAPETDWAYETALYAQSISTLGISAPLIPLQQMVSEMLQPKELAAPTIAWSSLVYCTKNFAYAVQLGSGKYNEYLRPVESFLQLPNGYVVLLSEREADALLELACEIKLPGSKAWLAHHEKLAAVNCSSIPQMLLLCYAQEHHVSGGERRSPRLSLSLSHQSASLPPVSADVLVSLGLLNGDSNYGKTQVELLRKFMIGKRESAEQLVGMRGKQSLLPRSELDKVVNDVR